MKSIFKGWGETRIVEGTPEQRRQMMEEALYRHCKTSSNQLDGLMNKNPKLAKKLKKLLDK
jgi:hypothetical protein